MRTLCLVLVTTLLVSGCEKSKPMAAKRVELQRTGGTTFELRPTEGQFEHCLAYTVSRSGLTRQLTMSRKNESFHCPPAQPIGGHSFKVPLNEGPVKIYVLFTTIAVNAGSVSQQLLDATNRQAVNVMDLRLPGAATLETIDFVPEEDVAATVGAELGADAGVADAGAADAGEATPPADGGPQ